MDLTAFLIHTPHFSPLTLQSYGKYHLPAVMEDLPAFRDSHPESPDPSSHAANVYDTVANESDWVDEVDDDDMDFEPPTNESEDTEFFDPAEEEEEEEDTEFHGACSQLALLDTPDWIKTGS